MKTDFLMLWVDDQRHVIDALVLDLERWLDNKGFVLKTLIHTDAKRVIDDIRNNEVELIIIDYKLRGKNGDILIEEIRQQGFYEDIVFYSEGGPPTDKNFDGVHYVSKEDANMRIKKVIELKLKRTSDPISIRGWIVADAIELEGMVTELLFRCFGEKEGFTLAKRLLHPDKRPFIDFGAKQMLLSGVLKDLISHLEAHNEMDEQEIGQLKNYRTIFNDFTSDIIHIRNAIAHQKVEDLATGRVIRKQNGSKIILNEDTFIQIRKDLRKHRDNLIALQTYF